MPARNGVPTTTVRPSHRVTQTHCGALPSPTSTAFPCPLRAGHDVPGPGRTGHYWTGTTAPDRHDASENQGYEQ